VAKDLADRQAQSNSSSTRHQAAIPPTGQDKHASTQQDGRRTTRYEGESRPVANSTPRKNLDAKANGVKASQAPKTTAATTSPVFLAPRKRIFSNTVLRIGADGAMKREK
jgi:hypothetical protein